jgi:MFS family permease
MSFFKHFKFTAWLPRLNYQIWILAIGRFLSQVGTGFTLFYAPIFFVNQVGLSATTVGIGLGSQSISGVLGRLLGGSLSDGNFGRKQTLLLSSVVAAIASFVLAAANGFPLFVAGNLLMGLGIGLYWPSAEAMVADLAAPHERNEAFALNRLGDSLGLGTGVVLAGLLIGAVVGTSAGTTANPPDLAGGTGGYPAAVGEVANGAANLAYRALFVIDGISFLVLFAVVFWAIHEVHRATHQRKALQGWKEALGDRRLLVYCLVNSLFTTYFVQINSTLPLYFTNFVPAHDPTNLSGKGFSPLTISGLFTWHLVACVFCQLPIARWLNCFKRPHALMISASLWGLGFVGVWATGVVPNAHFFWAVFCLGILALATVAYLPSASATVVELAPESMRGIYLAVNSQCWAIGSFIGPPLGGWALDQPQSIAHGFWLLIAVSVIPAIAILHLLHRMMEQKS